MLHVFVFIVLGLLLIFLINMTYQFSALKKSESDKANAGSLKNLLINSNGFLYTSIVLIIILMLAYTWSIVRGTVYEGHLMEWLNIVVRLMHITFGIAWIGASFYFVFLENALNRTSQFVPYIFGTV